jgi:pimeloyl-ACP methyl ester carboxylesterase
VVAVRRVVDEFRRGRIAHESAQAAVDEVRDEAWFDLAYLPSNVSTTGLWPDMDFDPEPVFANVRVPTLLFYGEDDEWSPIEASVAAWERAAAKAGNDDVSVVRLKGAKHFPTIGGGEEIEAIAPEYERTLIAWLGRVTRAG